jgi:heptosyltransferase II
VASTVVIESKQGIGDVVWHLPYIRAIAAVSPGGKVIFLGLPSTHAQELLEAEPCVEQTFYFESRGSELQRLKHQLRLIALLRSLKCDTAWFLDRTMRPALASLLAGIPNRIGVGLGTQRWFITNPGIDRRRYESEVWAFVYLPALMQHMKVPVSGTEPDLKVPAAASAAVASLYGARPRPWIVLGLGASERPKDWSDAKWTAFIAGLRERAGTIFLIGGPVQATRGEAFIAASGGANVVNACERKLMEAGALIRDADLYIGPDSGPMNIAAAVGTTAFGLFGMSKVLTYSRYIHPIEPDDGRGFRHDGMEHISPESVLARIAPYLADAKTKA